MIICSQNFSLGLHNKIDLARNWIRKLNIDIMIIQEAEITQKTPINQLMISGYTIHHTNHSEKSRLAVYVRETIIHKVKKAQDCEIIKIETKDLDVYGIYRPFKTNMNKNQQINRMIEFIKTTKGNRDLVLIGDLNLDLNLSNNPGYTSFTQLQKWLAFTDELGLIQQINGNTWCRVINGTAKRSLLDHVYSKETTFQSIRTLDLGIGDHQAIYLEEFNKSKRNHNPRSPAVVRLWSKYSAESYSELISPADFIGTEGMNVDDLDHFISQKMMLALDKLAPEKTYHKDETKFIWSDKLVSIRRKKSNLIKRYRRTNDVLCLRKARSIDKQFRRAVTEETKRAVTKTLKRGTMADFWKAVNLANNPDRTDNFPPSINMGDTKARTNREKAELFAHYFESKVEKTGTKPVENEIHNGEKYFTKEIELDMSEKLINKVITQMRPKTCYGFDRVPSRLYKDAKQGLIGVIMSLFKKIVQQNKIPDIWRVSRIIPIHKKGSKAEVENYRPISNLCSLEKIYERCILENLNNLSEFNLRELTGSRQFGFCRNKSTTTLAMQLQHRLAKALDEGRNAAVVSLDLTAAFDVIDHELLIKRLKLFGIPNPITNLIRDWLINRVAYVECQDSISRVYKITKGTIQGSVLGPVLFSLYMRPLLDIEDLDAFADDNYIMREENDLKKLKQSIQEAANRVLSWLVKSGLEVNLKKTEVTFFCRKMIEDIEDIAIGNTTITIKDHMKVLGIEFDSRLTWARHVDKIILEAKRASHGLRRLSRFIPQERMMELATAFVYSKLYYGAVVWLNEAMAKPYWKRILAVSAHTIKNALGLYEWNLSYKDLHELAGRAMPKQMSDYQKCLALYNILRDGNPPAIASEINDKISIHKRTDRFHIPDDSKTKLGRNSLANRLGEVCGQLQVEDFELEKVPFKMKMKRKFLK
jgi:Reverse transcriptase (RNA-dependent DNA polymerase)